MQDFKDKVAVITGGASGVGRSLAFSLGRRGARVVVGDVDNPAMEETLSALAGEGIDAVAEFCDVTSVDSLTALADKAEGAFAGPPLNITEFDYGNKVAIHMDEYASEYDFDVGIFIRDEELGYSSQVDKAYSEADSWGADLAIELHFNGGPKSARGCLVLSSGSSGSMRYARTVQNYMVDLFKAAGSSRDRGVVTRTRGQRGGRSLHAGKAPAIMVEPFFGSSPADCKMMKEIGFRAYAVMLLEASQEALGIMPRKNIKDSSTVKVSDAGKWAGTGIGLTGAVSLANEATGALPMITDAMSVIRDNFAAVLLVVGIAVIVGFYLTKRGRIKAWLKEQ